MVSTKSSLTGSKDNICIVVKRTREQISNGLNLPNGLPNPPST